MMVVVVVMMVVLALVNDCFLSLNFIERSADNLEYILNISTKFPAILLPTLLPLSAHQKPIV